MPQKAQAQDHAADAHIGRAESEFVSAGAYSWVAYHGVSSVQECTRKLASLRRHIERTDGHERDALIRKAAELEVATDYMESHNLLSVRISSSRSNASTKQPVVQAGKPHSEQRERSRATEQSREPAQDRSER